MSFQAQINDWVRETKARQEAVLQESSKRIIAVMQTPGPSVANPLTSAGGALPLDTGFLRSSLSAQIGMALPAPRANPDAKKKYAYESGPIDLTINGMTIADTLTVAYAANYSRIAEVRYAFVRLAAQRWPQVVSEVCTEVRSKAGA